MRLFCDTEFNGHNGDLISIALVEERGEDHFYGIVNQLAGPMEPWVIDNVMPVLVAQTTRTFRQGTLEEIRREVGWYIAHRAQRAGVIVYADWPADFRHLMKLMEGPSFEQSWMVPLRMHLVQTPPGQPVSRVPHNALADAIDLRDWYVDTLWATEAVTDTR